MWPLQGAYQPFGLLKKLEGLLKKLEFDWVERQTLAENLKIRGKHNYLFPEGPVFKL